MPIADMKAMLAHARANAYAVGAFDVIDLDFVSGIVAAAERSRSPLILSLAESHFPWFDFEMLMAAVETAARRATVPVAIHLDHGASLDSAIQAIRHGCNGVMVDASEHPLQENIRLTRSIVDMAHACGVPVEGELGYVPGVEGLDAELHPGDIVYTAVDEAKTFVEQTGVDFLAVSIGTVHGRSRGTPRLDYQRLQDINDAAGIPLVLHGGTGLEEQQYRRLIASGICKINYFTALGDAAAAALRRQLNRSDSAYAELTQGAAEAIGAEAERCMNLWGSAGRADELLAHCPRWSPAEHLIIYNADSEATSVQAMMDRGREVLAAIPGVRAVFTGQAIQENARYRYTWLVRFCHPRVIDSYREHPQHIAFADTLFRPIAGDRISIDYQETVPVPENP